MQQQIKIYQQDDNIAPVRLIKLLSVSDRHTLLAYIELDCMGLIRRVDQGGGPLMTSSCGRSVTAEGVRKKSSGAAYRIIMPCILFFVSF
ncbi:MAG: hypothetical protein DRH21_07750 [Deltaproteobacteria bacterium]|nr:MAG: hypothetical protein DRH21_07750 [Deltaproteobacteria bacterium]